MTLSQRCHHGPRGGPGDSWLVKSRLAQDLGLHQLEGAWMHTSYSVPGGLEMRSQMTGASAARLARAQQHAAPRIGISVRSA